MLGQQHKSPYDFMQTKSKGGLLASTGVHQYNSGDEIRKEWWENLNVEVGDGERKYLQEDSCSEFEDGECIACLLNDFYFDSECDDEGCSTCGGADRSHLPVINPCWYQWDNCSGAPFYDNVCDFLKHVEEETSIIKDNCDSCQSNEYREESKVVEEEVLVREDEERSEEVDIDPEVVEEDVLVREDEVRSEEVDIDPEVDLTLQVGGQES